MKLSSTNRQHSTINPWGKYPVKTKVAALAKRPARRIRVDMAEGHKADVTYEVYDPKIHRLGGAS